MEASVSVSNLYKRYSDTLALNGLSLHVQPGMIFGVLGPNGSGKTTLLKIMSGIIDRSGGEVRVLGLDPSYQRDEVKRLIGYVPETPVMYESLSPREFFSFVASVRHVPATLAEQRVNSLTDALGLYSQMDSFIGALSFGTRQKVAIVAALIHDPDIIVMDEGMNGLDPRSAKIVKELLKDFSRRGKTVIFSTHVMGLAESVCDTVAIIYRGKVAGTGTLEDLRQGSGNGVSNLEEIFLSLTGNDDLDPLIENIKESFKK